MNQNRISSITVNGVKYNRETDKSDKMVPTSRPDICKCGHTKEAHMNVKAKCVVCRCQKYNPSPHGLNNSEALRSAVSNEKSANADNPTDTFSARIEELKKRNEYYEYSDKLEGMKEALEAVEDTKNHVIYPLWVDGDECIVIKKKIITTWLEELK